MLAEGFLAYQWEKDGVIQSNKTNIFTATLPGKYRARFSRKSSYPTEAQWNRWSDVVTVTQLGTTATASARTTTADLAQVAEEQITSEEALAFDVYPNPASVDNIRLNLRGMTDAPLQVRIVDQLGRERYNNIFESPTIAAAETLSLPADSKGGVYILMIDQGKTQVRRKVMVQE